MDQVSAFVIGDDYSFLDELCSSASFVATGVFSSFEEAHRCFDSYIVMGRLPDVILVDSNLKNEYRDSAFCQTIKVEHNVPVLVVKLDDDGVVDDDLVYLFRPITSGQLRESIRNAQKITKLQEVAKYNLGNVLNNSSIETAKADQSVFDEQYKAVKRLQQLMIATVQNTIEGIIIVNPKGYIEYLNPSFEEIVDRKRYELVGKHIKGFKSDKFSSSLLHALKKIAVSGTPWKGNIKIEDKIYDLYVGAIKNPKDNVLGYAAIFADMTHRQSMAKDFIRSQKVEVVETLSGGIAHDFNNIILALQANIEALMELSEGNKVTDKYFMRILSACGRADDLVKKFLNFSRNSKEEMAVVSIRNTVEEVVELMQASVPDNVGLNLNVHDNTGDIYANPTNIYEVVMNLICNSIDALKGKPGSISVELCSEIIPQYNSFEMDPGEYVKLTVADTGEGIPEEVAGRIFEPFYTTKKTGKGYGLGLSVIQQIVESLNGHIGLKSKIEEWTQFYIYIPVYKENTADKNKPLKKPVNLPEGPERILWVYDIPVEESRTMPGFLRKLGYRVTMAKGGDEAVRMFNKAPLKYDMVISDKVMNSSSGGTAFKHIFKIRPDIPAILLTRYNDTIELSFGVANKLVMLIKPVEESIIEDTVKVLFSKRNLSAVLMK